MTATATQDKRMFMMERGSLRAETWSEGEELTVVEVLYGGKVLRVQRANSSDGAVFYTSAEGTRF
jgi:hypothetical protein